MTSSTIRFFDYKDEQVDALEHFLGDVHERLSIPMVLQYKNNQYPICLAENHSGINAEQKLLFSNFLKKKLTSDTKNQNFNYDEHFKIIGHTENQFHIALKRELVENIILAYSTNSKNNTKHSKKIP